MGIACAPGMFQSIIQDFQNNLEYSLFNIDDLLILKWEDKMKYDHLKHLKEALSQLEEQVFCENLQKSFFMQKEVK